MIYNKAEDPAADDEDDGDGKEADSLETQGR